MKRSFGLSLLLFAVLFLGGCAASRKSKIAKKNQETVRIWYEEGWNRKNNMALLESTFAPDWFDANPIRGNQADGIEGIRATVRYFSNALPDAHFTITHLFGDDKFTVVRYTFTATHTGESFGIAATGKKFSTTGSMIYRMEKGKIKTTWAELDMLGIINQLIEGGK